MLSVRPDAPIAESRAMRRFVAYLAVGSAFATAEEFLTVVVLRGDVASYLFTLLVLFPTYLTVAYAASQLLDRLPVPPAARDLAHLSLFGSVGLALEWTLMGLAPWSNPTAPPLLMFGFQAGMFAFWATVATAPRVFLNPRGCEARRRIVRFCVPYFIAAYALGIWVPSRLRFATIVPSVIVGYLTVVGLLIRHVVETWPIGAGTRR